MTNLPRAAAPVAEITAFPEDVTSAWRREFAQCHTYTDALELVYRIIRERERANKVAAKTKRRDGHQLAFPWGRAE